MKNCKWGSTVHDGHWICATCGYNQWGASPPLDCMEEESREQLRSFIISYRQDYMNRILRESNE